LFSTRVGDTPACARRKQLSASTGSQVVTGATNEANWLTAQA